MTIFKSVFTSTPNTPLKKLNDKDRQIYNNILHCLNFKKYKPIRGQTELAGYKNSKINFKDRVNESNLFGREIEKLIIPSNIIDIYTGLEVLLGLKLSGHTDTLTEASNSTDEFYTRGNIHNEQEDRNDLDNFRTQNMELRSKS